VRCYSDPHPKHLATPSRAELSPALFSPEAKALMGVIRAETLGPA